MQKKYLSLEEAAGVLGIPQEELRRLREKGDIRGFADRGNWKFKTEDVESLARKYQTDSSPEVKLYEGDDLPPFDEINEKKSSAKDEDFFDSLMDSDSDVSLIGDEVSVPELSVDSDSDIKLPGSNGNEFGKLGTEPEIPILKSNSDSDIKLVRPDSDSDVKLSAKDSDSDVQLIGQKTESQDFPSVGGKQKTDSELPLSSHSDSDIRLGGQPAGNSDDDEDINFSFSGPSGSVFDDESGISLGGPSSAMLAGSGINLTGPSDSGIGFDLDDEDPGLTLASDDDDDSGISLDLQDSGISMMPESGISLEGGESGISLEPEGSGYSFDLGDSGISIADDDSGIISSSKSKPKNPGTMPMMDLASDDEQDVTTFDIPSVDDNFAEVDKTGLIDQQDYFDDQFQDDEDFGSAQDGSGEYDLDFSEQSFGEDDNAVFGEADEDGFGEGSFGTEDGGFAPVASSRKAPVEAEWGVAWVAVLSVSSLLLLLCGAVMIDLVQHTATSNSLNPVSGAIVNLVGGPFKS